MLTAVIVGLLLSGCNGTGGTDTENAVVIRMVHATREMDPAWRDPVTGEPYMGQQERDARLYAERQVLEKFGVRFAWIDSEGKRPEEDILRTVLAGDPYGDMIKLGAWVQGQVLSQNVIQPLDDFAGVFDDDDSSWMLLGKVFGHHYFIDDEMRNGGYAPLVYNIGLLNEVPALKENGKLVLPVDLWLEGRWTWSAFEDYLQKIHDYFRGGDVIAYSSSYNWPALQAMHSNGASLYGDNGLEMDSPASKEAVAFIDRLVQRNLLFDRGADPLTGSPGWSPSQFLYREAVFHNLMQWWTFNLVADFRERGDTIGVVPFPRPDNMPADDPRYRQLNEAYDVWAVPRGVDREKAQLAVSAFREYTVSYYRKMADSQRALDFLQSDDMARASAVNLFLDITNEDYGEKILDAWKYLGSFPHKNEFAANAALWDWWGSNVLGASLVRAPGISNYSVHVETMMPVVNERLNSIQKVLNSTEVVDNIPPVFTDIDVAGIAFPAGTNPGEIDWNRFLTVSDNVDGTIDIASSIIDISAVDFSRPGIYNNAASFSVSDTSGNERKAERTVVVFDAANTTVPSLVIKNGFRTIALNEDTANISWRGDFVESATDKDGLDISNSVFADLSELNTTVAGDYNVTIFVKDYAGNEASAGITVSVE